MFKLLTWQLTKPNWFNPSGYSAWSTSDCCSRAIQNPTSNFILLPLKINIVQKSFNKLGSFNLTAITGPWPAFKRRQRTGHKWGHLPKNTETRHGCHGKYCFSPKWSHTHKEHLMFTLQSGVRVCREVRNTGGKYFIISCRCMRNNPWHVHKCTSSTAEVRSKFDFQQLHRFDKYWHCEQMVC